MADYTLRGTYTLPSLGKIYGYDNINPEVTLRSMTTVEEMRRVNHSERVYQIMAEIIDDCIVDNQLPISCYDMCLADYQFLLHKLRVVTYGNEYKITSVCPYCGSTNTTSIDLDSFKVNYFDEEEFKKYLEFDLPKTQKHIKIRMQTPRVLDGITVRSKEQRKKTPNMAGDPAFLFTLESLIAEIDGKKPDPMALSNFVRTMPMADANYLLKYSEKLVGVFGLETDTQIQCSVCGLEYLSSFRTTGEFFGPSID